MPSFKIAIGLATRGDDLIPSLVQFIHYNMNKHGAEFIWKACGFSASIAQEQVFQEAEKKNVDYLLMIDSDVMPPMDAIDKLLSCNKDMIVAPIWHYSAYHGILHLNVTRKLGDHLFHSKESGIEEMEAASFGCFLISKRVLKEFVGRREMFVTWSSLLPRELFGSSSDTVLFKKAEKMGFKLYVCWDVKGCEHFTKVHLSNRVLGNFINSIAQEVKE